MATLATENNYAGGDAYTKEDFFSKCAATVSLYCETPSVSADEIAGSLQNSHPVICLVKANTLTTKAHYVICAGVNSDGTLVVYDPISSEVSSRPWAVSTIVSYSSKIFVMHPSSDGTGGSSSDASGADDASSTDEASSDSSSE